VLRLAGIEDARIRAGLYCTPPLTAIFPATIRKTGERRPVQVP
jgi:hypothetical protein